MLLLFFFIFCLLLKIIIYVLDFIWSRFGKVSCGKMVLLIMYNLNFNLLSNTVILTKFCLPAKHTFSVCPAALKINQCLLRSN